MLDQQIRVASAAVPTPVELRHEPNAHGVSLIGRNQTLDVDTGVLAELQDAVTDHPELAPQDPTDLLLRNAGNSLE